MANKHIRSLTGQQISKKLLAGLLICLLGSWLASCVSLPDLEASQEYNQDIIGVADGYQIIGQTFVARRSRFTGIQLWLNLKPNAAQKGSMTVNVYHTPDDTQPIVHQIIPFSPAPKDLVIHLPPQPDSAGQAYFITLEAVDGVAEVLGRSEDIYAQGQSFTGQTPLNADIAFRLTYDYDVRALLADIWTWLARIGLLLPLGCVLLLPGWLLLSFSGLQSFFDFGERVALSVGLSLAAIPLLMLWTTQLGLHWTKLSVTLIAALLALLAISHFLRQFRSIRQNTTSLPDQPHPPDQTQNTASLPEHLARLIRQIRPVRLVSLTPFILAGIFALSLLVRLAMVRDLAAPAWVDSVHHAAITRLIVEQGGFPQTYAPFINIDAVEYHPGFHAGVAAFQWLSNLDIPEALQLYGQVLNALAVFAVYLLSTTLTRRRSAGLVAALVTGLVTPMPAYYASWGRYTQIAGLLILPVVITLVRLLLEENRGVILLSSTALAGLFLVHYRVEAFAFCLLIPYFTSQVPFKRRKFIEWVQKNLWFWSAAGVVAVLLTLPWLLPTITRVLLPTFQAAQGTGEAPKLFADFSWYYLNPALGIYATILAGIGLVICIFLNLRLAITLSFWGLLLFLLASLGALRLPGSSFVNMVSVEITLFMPVSVLVGYLVSQFITVGKRFLPSRWSYGLYGTLAVLGIAVTILGAQRLLPILNPATFLFREADRPAMTWIENNLPEEAVILINPFLWGYSLYGGADGGFWISPLTGRQTIPPPVLYGLGDLQEIQHINRICQETLNSGGDAVKLAQLLKTEGIRYVYIGKRGGILSPNGLAHSPLFETLYSQDGSWVFAVK